MRWNTLANVRGKLKAELGFANVANAIQDYELNTLLENKQEWLAAEFDWPFLKHRFDVSATAGSQYLSFATATAEGYDPLTRDVEADEPPTFDMNTDREAKVEVYYNLKWESVKYGIGSQEYNIWDSRLQQTNDPVQRWMYYDQGQFEVWPIPATTQRVRFEAYRYPLTLRNTDATFNDAAKLDMDDLLVIYYCAAERLARSEQKDAAIKQQLAVERLRQVRASLPSRERKVIFGNSERDQKQLRKVVPIIGVHG